MTVDPSAGLYPENVLTIILFTVTMFGVVGGLKWLLEKMK